MEQESRTQTVLVKSVIPYYLVGAVWIFYGLIFGMYRWYHYLLCAAVSVAVYYVAARVIPPKKVTVELPRTIAESGDAAIDRQIAKATESIRHIEEYAKTLNEQNPAFAAQIRKLADRGYQILDCLAKRPEKVSLLRRFLNYYLPTLEKLLREYPSLCDTPSTTDTAKNIESIASKMETVFERQLQKLRFDDELDISADIDVLDTMLKQDGFQLPNDHS